MKKYAIIGYPLGHSLSPLIHKMIMEQAGVQGAYDSITIPPDKLAAVFENSLCELDGYNVTIPHKVAILPKLHSLDQRAALFGAVNVVKNTDGLYAGYNTDCYGFLMALQRAGIRLGGRTLLCGCGGVARMIAFECVLAGCDLTIAIREADREMAAALADEILEKLDKSVCICLLEETEGQYDLIVNGTPVGMYPHTGDMPLSEPVAALAGAVYDTVYNPRETRLVQTAKAHGVPAVGGMDMLVCQAVKAQEIFNSIDCAKIDVDTIIEACYRELEERA